MKIVFLSTNFPPDPGGIAELSARLCEQLSARHHVVTVLAHRHPGHPISQAVHGATVVRLFKPCPFTTNRALHKFLALEAWKFRTQRTVLKQVRRLAPDVVVCGNYHSLLTPAIVGGLTCSYFFYLHGGELATAARSRVPWRKASLRRGIQHAAWTFCNSGFTLGLLHALCGREMTRASVTGCGVPIDWLTEPPDRGAARQRLGWADEPVLLTVARLVDNKGIDNVIRALPLIQQRLPRCRYIVAGDGSLGTELREMAGRLGLGHAVSLVGHVSNHVRSDLYEAADLYVLTSRLGRLNEIEGFGISLLEANARGLAVIGSRVGGIPDAVEDGVNGLLVPPDDPPALAQAVWRLFAEPNLRSQLAHGGQQRIRDRFNWHAIGGQVEQKLFEVVTLSTPQGTRL